MRNFLALLTLPAMLGAYASAPAFATDSLQALLEKAKNQSPVLKKASAEKTEGEWKQKEGFANFLPTVTLGASHFFEKQYQYLNIPFGGGPVVVFPQIFPTTSGTLSARWTLFDGLANVNLYRSSSRLKEAADAQYRWAEFQLSREVTLAYFKWVATVRLKEVSEENLKTLENHYAQIVQLKTAGLATPYDLLKVEAQLSEAKSEAQLAADNIEIAKDRLKVAVANPDGVDPAESPLPSPEPQKVQSTEFKSDSSERFDLVALENQAEAASRLDAASAFFWVPKISLGADYIKYNNLTDSFSDWNSYRNAWSVGVFLNWTLFNAKDFSLAKENQYKAIAAAKNLEQVLLNAPVDFSFWKKRYLYSASLYTAKNADLNRAKETVRLAQAGFKAGVRTTTEVLDAELELFRARAGIVNTQINCIEAKLKLELALGESL